MTTQDFNEMYGSVVMPGACVSVPAPWLPAIHEAVTSIAALPSEIKTFVMVMAIIEVAREICTARISGISA